MPTPKSGAQTQRTIAPVVRKIKLSEQTSDFAYWQTQPYEALLAALMRSDRSTTAGPMKLSRDFKEFVESLNANDVRYLVVG